MELAVESRSRSSLSTDSAPCFPISPCCWPVCVCAWSGVCSESSREVKGTDRGCRALCRCQRGLNPEQRSCRGGEGRPGALALNPATFESQYSRFGVKGARLAALLCGGCAHTMGEDSLAPSGTLRWNNIYLCVVVCL